MDLKKIKLGRSDLAVTPICLGTMTFGEQVDEPTAHQILARSLARGGAQTAHAGGTGVAGAQARRRERVYAQFGAFGRPSCDVRGSDVVRIATWILD